MTPTEVSIHLIESIPRQVSSSHFETPQSHLSDHIRSPRANPFVERLPFRAFVDWFWKARKIRSGRAKVPVEKIYAYIAIFLVQRIQINVQLRGIHFITQFVFIAPVVSTGQRMKFQRMEMQLPRMCSFFDRTKQSCSNKKRVFLPNHFELSLTLIVHFYCKINFKEIVSLSKKFIQEKAVH